MITDAPDKKARSRRRAGWALSFGERCGTWCQSLTQVSCWGLLRGSLATGLQSRVGIHAAENLEYLASALKQYQCRHLAVQINPTLPLRTVMEGDCSACLQLDSGPSTPWGVPMHITYEPHISKETGSKRH